MLNVRNGLSIHIYCAPIDMRKSVNGLSALVVDAFDVSPQSGNLYIFYNRSRNRIKILFWDGNGFVIYYKRLERNKFMQEDEKICVCGCELTCIGDERSEQVEIIPAKIHALVHIRKKYACRSCEQTVRQAKMPKQPIPKSIATPGLLSHILVSKFEDHLPLYRQEKMLQRIGIDIARSTLCSWVIKSAELLKPLINLMQSNIIDYDIAYADETRM